VLTEIKSLLTKHSPNLESITVTAILLNLSQTVVELDPVSTIYNEQIPDKQKTLSGMTGFFTNYNRRSLSINNTQQLFNKALYAIGIIKAKGEAIVNFNKACVLAFGEARHF
jgi:hypothetical protein